MYVDKMQFPPYDFNSGLNAVRQDSCVSVTREHDEIKFRSIKTRRYEVKAALESLTAISKG